MNCSKAFKCVAVVTTTTVLLAGCASGGKTIITDEVDHQVNVLTATQDSKPLSILVRQALRKNGQTAISPIRVSQDSADTVKLTGYVNDSAIIHEAERVAYQIDGVRFVVNNLAIRN